MKAASFTIGDALDKLQPTVTTGISNKITVSVIQRFLLNDLRLMFNQLEAK